MAAPDGRARRRFGAAVENLREAPSVAGVGSGSGSIAGLDGAAWARLVSTNSRGGAQPEGVVFLRRPAACWILQAASNDSSEEIWSGGGVLYVVVAKVEPLYTSHEG